MLMLIERYRSPPNFAKPQMIIFLFSLLYFKLFQNGRGGHVSALYTGSATADSSVADADTSYGGGTTADDTSSSVGVMPAVEQAVVTPPARFRDEKMKVGKLFNDCKISERVDYFHFHLPSLQKSYAVIYTHFKTYFNLYFYENFSAG